MKQRLFVVALLLFALVLILPAPASATVYSFDFEPKSGGPGTVVTVSGIVPRTEIVVELGVASTPPFKLPSEYVTDYQSRIILGRAMPNLSKGCCEVPFITTVEIPAYWPDGKPITESILGIVIRDTKGEIIHQTTSRLFTFTPGPLPATGDSSYIGVMVAIFASLAFIVAGSILRWRLAHNRRKLEG